MELAPLTGKDIMQRAKPKLEFFDSLPKLARCMLVNADNTGSSLPGGAINFACDVNMPKLESPIEQIFIVGFEIVKEWLGEIYSPVYSINLFSQFEIKTNGKKYIADFAFISEKFADEHDTKLSRNLNLVIECDGHDFHEKTKEQVAYGNDRDFDLKEAGYEVIHFSGSQIFNNPYGCAGKVMIYILRETGLLTEWQKTYSELKKSRCGNGNI